MKLNNGDIYYSKKYKRLIIIVRDINNEGALDYLSSINVEGYSGILETRVLVNDPYMEKQIESGELKLVGNVKSLIRAMINVFDELPEA